MSDPSPGPLAGIRVIDVGTRISAPFCAGLLGELGADVIKVELPGEGDFMRTIGPFVPVEDGPDYSLFWAVEGRGRRGVTCDLRKPEGKELFKRLVATADVLCENFRPGTMERWGLGPDDLPDDLVYVRISVFGQTGPYARARGSTGSASPSAGSSTSRANPTARPCGPASRSRTTSRAPSPPSPRWPRSTAATRTGQGGDVIDAPLYGSILRILEWTLAGYDKLGIVRQREGNRLSTSAPLDNYPTADGFFICIVAGSDANFHRLCTAMDRPGPDRGPPLPHAGRAGVPQRRDQRHRGRLDLEPPRRGDHRPLRRARRPGRAPPTAPPTSSPTPTWPPGVTSCRSTIRSSAPVRQQAPFPRLAKHPAPVPRGAPRLGEHNREVWCDLVGLSDDELADLGRRGVV